MKNRKYITKYHMIIEILSVILMAASLGIAIYGMITLPETIPTHFDINGKADGYGSPGAMLILPITMFVTFGIISLLIHLVSPEFWNMPFKVKEEKKEIVYKDMVYMMCMFELETAVYTLYMTYMMFLQVMTQTMLVTVIYTVALIFTMIYYCVIAYKHNK